MHIAPSIKTVALALRLCRGPEKKEGTGGRGWQLFALPACSVVNAPIQLTIPPLKGPNSNPLEETEEVAEVEVDGALAHGT